MLCFRYKHGVSGAQLDVSCRANGVLSAMIPRIVHEPFFAQNRSSQSQAIENDDLAVVASFVALKNKRRCGRCADHDGGVPLRSLFVTHCLSMVK